MSIVGGFGLVVTEDDALDAIDVPPELVAVTEKVYGVFGVNPVTVIGDDAPDDISPKLLVIV